MKFRTEYKAERSQFTLDPEKPVVLMGSCFTQNIASRMLACGWKALNPASTLYNPVSIGIAVKAMIEPDGLDIFEKSLFFHNGLWNSFMFGSSFSSRQREDCIEEFSLRRQEFIENLKEGKILILTYGTSICYHLNDTGEVVGNCHKLPASAFYRKRMSVDEVVACGKATLEKIRKVSQDTKIIFTVSPVRHLKDGFEGNNRSKAVLSLGIEEICMADEDCSYFPAFEILNDDLRDYRFYASDLCHPSEEAVEYVWQKFKETYLDDADLKRLEEGRKRVASSEHRPLRGALGKPLS